MVAEPRMYSQNEINIIPIPLKKIKPLYIPQITEVFIKRTNNNFPFLDTFDLLLPVEKHPQKDEYYLVGRYDCYLYMKNNKNLKEAYCIVEEFSGRTSQYLKTLRRLHNNGDSSKINKQNILNKLQSRNLLLAEIFKKTGFTKQDLVNYQYKPNIPHYYINAYTTEATLNWIEGLKLEKPVKDFLYKSAGLPRRSEGRLTDEKRKFLQHFFTNAKRFQQISVLEQVEVLADALKFKKIAMAYLQGKIDEHLE